MFQPRRFPVTPRGDACLVTATDLMLMPPLRTLSDAAGRGWLLLVLLFGYPSLRMIIQMQSEASEPLQGAKGEGNGADVDSKKDT